MKINHPLMHNNFIKSDMDSVRKLIKNKNLILTQSKNVIEFEKKWSKWLGVKFSVFVNSGSSANLLSMLILKSLSLKKKEIIVPTLTWVSDINSVIMAGFKPILGTSKFGWLGSPVTLKGSNAELMWPAPAITKLS